MRKYIHHFAFIGLFLVSFLSSSCFDVLEELYVSADGSGSLKITMDMSEMGELLKSLGESEGEEGGDNPMAELNEAMGSDDVIIALQQLDGVHNVKDHSDPDNYIVSYSFDFDEVAVLNEVMGSGGGLSDLLSMPLGDETSEAAADPREYNLKGKKFSTKGATKMPEPDNEEDKMSYGLVMAMMKDASYKVVMKFEKEVKSVKKNDNAILGPDGHSVILETSFADLLTGESDFNSQIKLK